MNPLANFFRGAIFFWSGIGKLFRHPRLLIMSLFPILLTILVLVGIAIGGAYLIGEWLAKYPILGLENRIFLQSIIVLLALFFSYLVYLPLTRIFLAPFSEKLSLRTTKILGKSAKSEQDLGFFHAIGEGVKLVAMQLCVVAIILLLTIVAPPVGVPVGIFATICFCGMDFLDVPLSIRGYSFKQKRSFWRRNFPSILGFSLAAYLLLHVPVLNLLALPVGVIGATLLLEQAEPEKM